MSATGGSFVLKIASLFSDLAIFINLNKKMKLY